jgi:hypothetical protein
MPDGIVVLRKNSISVRPRGERADNHERSLFGHLRFVDEIGSKESEHLRANQESLAPKKNEVSFGYNKTSTLSEFFLSDFP